MKSKISILAFALCMVFALSVFAVGSSAALPDGYEGYTEIANEAALLDLMGSTDATKLAGKYVLTANITLTSASQSPIGNADAPFTGIFDGNGKTISGLNLSGTENVGLFGVANGATIKNLTVSGTVTATGNRTAGIVAYAQTSLTVENCTSNATVSGVYATGGIVGQIDGLTAPPTVSVKGCTNTGAVTASSERAGGIIGFFNIGGAAKGGSYELTECRNSGTVTAKKSGNAVAYAAGIVGFYTQSTTVDLNISKLLNEGDVHSDTGKYTGGIFGYFRSYAAGVVMSDLMNTGDVYTQSVPGGLIGFQLNEQPITVNRAYVNCTLTGASSVEAVGNFKATSVLNGVYYISESTSKWGEKATLADTIEGNKAAFPLLEAGNAWKFTANGPILAFTHPTCTYVDGVCTVCGEADPTACKHLHKDDDVKTAATCTKTGLKDIVCTDCGETLETDVVIPIDANNHAEGFAWEKNAEGTYDLACNACLAKMIENQTELPTVYLSNKGSDAALSTETAPVQSLEEAVKRLVKTGGSVYLLNRCTITKSIDLPTWEGKITFCSTTDANGNANNGFYFDFTSDIDKYDRLSDNNICLSLGGDAEFNNIVFKGKNAYKSVETPGKDTVLVIAANWHNVDFTYVRTHDRARVFFVAGEFLATESNADVKDVTVNICGPAVSSGNPTGFVPFYRVILGDWFGTSDAIDIANKKVTLNVQKGKFSQAKVELVFAMSTHDYNGRCAGIASNCESVINLYDASVINRLRTGNTNTTQASSTASLDSLVLNFNDNSNIGADAAIRNAKNTVLNISNAEAGRTTAIGRVFAFAAGGAFANETAPATVTASYGTHSFTSSVENPIDVAARYTLTANITDECTYKGAIADGAYTLACETCGRSKTVLALAEGTKTTTTARNAVRFIAEMTLGEGATVEKYGMFITALENQTVGSGSFADENFVYAEGDDVTGAKDGKLSFATTLVGIPADKGDTPIYAWAYVKLAGVNDLVVLPFAAATANGLAPAAK